MANETAVMPEAGEGASQEASPAGSRRAQCGMQKLLADASAPPRHPFCALCEEPAGTSSPDSARCVRMAMRIGMRLFERGARTDFVYVLASGIVKETTASPDGSECAVRLVMRGGVTGLPAMLGIPQPHSAYVIHPGTACRVPVARLQDRRARDAGVAEQLFLDWLQAVQDADCMISVLGHGAARSRMARLLLMLDQANESSAPLRLRRTDMADLLSITPVSVARLLSEFSREALFVERNRCLVALDHERLRQIARSPSGRVGTARRGAGPRRGRASGAAYT